MKTFIVAIDGPNSSGKSTVAKEVAKRLGITYIDTGAMYRALGYYFVKNGIEINEENAEKYIKIPSLEFSYEGGNTKVVLDGEDISDKIRTAEIGMAASNISKILVVREYLVELQRNMVNTTSVIMEGRDIGSVVFPNADLKIYLTADISERAKRRLRDYQKIGKSLTIAEVKEEIEKRDYQDMHRENSPLVQVEDAILLDNTDISFESTIKKVIELINKI